MPAVALSIGNVSSEFYTFLGFKKSEENVASTLIMRIRWIIYRTIKFFSPLEN